MKLLSFRSIHRLDGWVSSLTMQRGPNSFRLMIWNATQVIRKCSAGSNGIFPFLLSHFICSLDYPVNDLLVHKKISLYRSFQWWVLSAMTSTARSSIYLITWAPERGPPRSRWTKVNYSTSIWSACITRHFSKGDGDTVVLDWESYNKGYMLCYCLSISPLGICTTIKTKRFVVDDQLVRFR